MTSIIAGNFDDYILILADTRVTFSNGKYEDNDHKIIAYPNGLVTGAGAVATIEPLKNKLMRSKPGQVTHIIKEFITQNKSNETDNKHITTFICCYLILYNNEISTRLLCFSDKNKYEPQPILNPSIIFPTDIKNSTKKEILSIFNNALQNPNTDPETISKIFYDSFQLISHSSSQVSENFDMAMLNKNSQIFYQYFRAQELFSFKFIDFNMGEVCDILRPDSINRSQRSRWEYSNQ